jgi:Heparinase II/III-like protein
MTHSRRAFLRKTSLMAAALPLVRLGAQTQPPPRPPAGRGLLFGPEDLPRIRANAQSGRFAAFWEGLEKADLADDTDFLEHHVRFNNHSVDMLRIRGIVERTAFVHALTGDPRQLAVARLAARRLVEYPKWDYFLEAGTKVIGIQRASETTIALAFALDWLGESLPAEEREAILHGIATKGAPACYLTLYGLKYPDRVKGWSMDPDDDYPHKVVNLKHWPLILNKTNLKVIPTAALGIAGCLLHGRHPQSEVWLDMARSSARAFSENYGPDGSYGEGVSYWGYTTLHMMLFAEVLWRTRGIDDRGLVNYPATIRYSIAMTMPRLPGKEAARHGKGYVGVQGVPAEAVAPLHDIVNFGDANGPVEISAASWAARTYRDPVCQWFARDLGEANSHYGMIWFDPELPASRPETAMEDDHMANDLVISRTGWAPADGVLALRSGGPANHEHADRNSIIFKAHGERLFNDPFRAAYPWTDPRWRLRLTESHTAVLIGGKGHVYHDGHEGTNASRAQARVTALRKGPGWLVVTSDATQAYGLVNPSVTLVDRTAVFLKPDILLILDRVHLSDHPLPVEARFQVFNDDARGVCSTSGTRFLIGRPFATLQATVAARGPLGVSTGRIPLPEGQGDYPFVQAVSEPGLRHALLTACTAAPSGDAHGELAIVQVKDGWTVSGSHRGRAVEVRFSGLDSGSGPAVELG